MKCKPIIVLLLISTIIAMRIKSNEATKVEVSEGVTSQTEEKEGARLNSETKTEVEVKAGAKQFQRNLWGFQNGWGYYYKNGHKYEFYLKRGKRIKGWQYLKWSKGKNWFCFDNNGVMYTGLHYLTSRNANEGKQYFYFDKSGVVATGWRQTTKDGLNDWFYFEPDTGKLISNGFYRLP